MHREGAEEFYRALAATGQRVSVGMEASGHARWFERLLAELRIELKVGERRFVANLRAHRRHFSTLQSVRSIAQNERRDILR